MVKGYLRNSDCSDVTTIQYFIGAICWSSEYQKQKKENGNPFLINAGKGIIVGANGDGVEFTFRAKQSLLDGSSTGINEIIPGSGTGKFEGCTGTIDLVGGWHEDGIGFWLKIQGYLVYK